MKIKKILKCLMVVMLMFTIVRIDVPTVLAQDEVPNFLTQETEFELTMEIPLEYQDQFKSVEIIASQSEMQSYATKWQFDYQPIIEGPKITFTNLKELPKGSYDFVLHFNELPNYTYSIEIIRDTASKVEVNPDLPLDFEIKQNDVGDLLVTSNDIEFINNINGIRVDAIMGASIPNYLFEKTDGVIRVSNKSLKELNFSNGTHNIIISVFNSNIFKEIAVKGVVLNQVLNSLPEDLTVTENIDGEIMVSTSDSEYLNNISALSISLGWPKPTSQIKKHDGMMIFADKLIIPNRLVKSSKVENGKNEITIYNDQYVKYQGTVDITKGLNCVESPYFDTYYNSVMIYSNYPEYISDVHTIQLENSNHFYEFKKSQLSADPNSGHIEINYEDLMKKGVKNGYYFVKTIANDYTSHISEEYVYIDFAVEVAPWDLSMWQELNGDLTIFTKDENYLNKIDVIELATDYGYTSFKSEEYTRNNNRITIPYDTWLSKCMPAGVYQVYISVEGVARSKSWFNIEKGSAKADFDVEIIEDENGNIVITSNEDFTKNIFEIMVGNYENYLTFNNDKTNGSRYFEIDGNKAIISQSNIEKLGIVNDTYEIRVYSKGYMRPLDQVKITQASNGFKDYQLKVDDKGDVILIFDDLKYLNSIEYITIGDGNKYSWTINNVSDYVKDSQIIIDNKYLLDNNIANGNYKLNVHANKYIVNSKDLTITKGASIYPSDITFEINGHDIILRSADKKWLENISAIREYSQYQTKGGYQYVTHSNIENFVKRDLENNQVIINDWLFVEDASNKKFAVSILSNGYQEYGVKNGVLIELDKVYTITSAPKNIEITQDKENNLIIKSLDKQWLSEFISINIISDEHNYKFDSYLLDGSQVIINREDLAKMSMQSGDYKLVVYAYGYDVYLSEIINIDTDKPKPEPTSTPEPTVEPTSTPKPTIEPTSTPEPTVEPTSTPKPTIEPTSTPEPTVEPTSTPKPTVKPTATPKPTVEPTSTPEPTVKPTSTPKPTVKPTATPKPTVEPTSTPKPTVEPTSTPKPTIAPTPTPVVVDIPVVEVQKEVNQVEDKTILTSNVEVKQETLEKEEKVDIKVELPTTKIVDDIINSETTTVELQITIPKAVTDNSDVNVTEIKASKDIFKAAQESKKDINVVVSNDDGSNAIEWKFPVDSLVDTNVDVNLSVQVSAPTETIHNNNISEKAMSQIQEENALVLTFAHTGALPGKAEVTVNVPSGYANGEKVYFYYFNEATDEYELLDSEIQVIDGKVTVSLDHCSSYVILKEEIKTVVEEKPVIEDVVDKSSNTNNLVIYAVVLGAILLGAFGLLVYRKSQKN